MKNILCIFILLFLTSCSTLPNTKKIETQHGEYSYHISGEGNFTVVLESGMGDNMTSWKPVLNLLETEVQVFTYNRAGFSGSKSKNEQRDGVTIVKELNSLLQKVDIKRPYILIGHSLGGLYMQLFAKTYPGEVAGIILIDSTYHGVHSLCQNEDKSYCTEEIPSWAKLVFPEAVAKEYSVSTLTLAQSRQSDKFPSLPLVVLSKGKPPKGIDGSSDLWKQQQKDQITLTMLSPISKQIICDQCGHYIHQDSPERIKQALDWILGKL